MIGSIIYHDNSVLPPVGALCVKKVAEFDQEEQKSAAVVLSTVDGVH